MPVPWRMPVKQVDSFRAHMVAWARDPDPHPENQDDAANMALVAELVSARSFLYRSVGLVNPSWPGRFRRPGIRRGDGTFAPEFASSCLLLAAPLLLHSIFWFLTVPRAEIFPSSGLVFALCPALTFINRGMQIGFASSLGNLCLNVLPVIMVLWEFRGTWSKPGHSPGKTSGCRNVSP